MYTWREGEREKKRYQGELLFAKAFVQSHFAPHNARVLRELFCVYMGLIAYTWDSLVEIRCLFLQIYSVLLFIYKEEITRVNSSSPKPLPHCTTLPHTATHCNTLQHTATHCNTLQHTINTRVNSSSPKPLPHCHTLPHTAAHCHTLQHTATHCSTLQHTATHCNTLQYTATHDKYQGELFFAKAFTQRHFQSHYIT